MKKSFILGLSGTVLGLGLAAGIGLGAMNAAPVTEANAADAVNGRITVDTTDGDWSNWNGNISVFFTDGTNKAWGSYVPCAKDQHLVEIEYDLGFVPTSMEARRYDPAYTETQWKANPDSSIWNKSAPLAFAADGHIVIEGWDDTNKRNNTETRYAYLHGSFADNPSSWGTIATLDKVKMNGSNNAEYYGDVAFVEGQQFGMKFWDDSWSVNFTLDSYVTGAFVHAGGSESGNIECVKAGTYSLYYDRNNKSLYINDPTYAQADEWAQTFLGTGDKACETVTMAGWNTFATTFGKLSDGAKNLMSGLDRVDHEAEVSTYYQKAVQRYDYVLERYGVTTSRPDFMSRSSKLSLARAINTDSVSDNAKIFSIAAIAVAGMAGIGMMLVFRRKKAVK